MADTSTDLLNRSSHEGGLNVCGIAPLKRISCISDVPCWNCEEKQVVRLFSGSGWYDDSRLCLACGEDNLSGHRPFERAWRAKNIKRAQEWLADAVPEDQFFALTGAAIRKEMDWSDGA